MSRWLYFTVAVLLCAAPLRAQFDNLPNTITPAPKTPADAPAPKTPAPKSPAESFGPKLEKPIVQQWRTGVTIRAVGGPCSNLSGTFPVPMDWPEQLVKQADEKLTTHAKRVNFRTTEGLLKQALFDIPLIPAGEECKIHLVFDVTSYVQVAPADTSGFVLPTKSATAQRKFLAPSPFLESTNTKFKNLVKEATEGKESAWEQVAAIYDAVREKIKHERSQNRQIGAAAAITNGKADREDMTAAFVAACRAFKVPARMVWVPDDCYAEFLLETADGDAKWFPAHVWGTEKQFGGLKEHKVILQKGDNLRVPESKDPQRFVPEYLTGKGKQSGKPSVEFVRRLEGAP